MEDELRINVVDAPCGAGKTSSAINFINNAASEYRFIYVTPFKDEVARICNACSKKHFVQPDDADHPKIVDIKIKLKNGENIATTHALFHRFDDEIIDLCFSQNYILIMDEVTDVIQAFKEESEEYRNKKKKKKKNSSDEDFFIAQKDAETLFEKYLDVDDEGLIHWRESQSDYKGVFTYIKYLADNGCLACYNKEADNKDKKIMIWLFPIKIFRAFRETYLLTYMFNAQLQKYYYDFYGLKYRYLYVAGNNIDSYHFTEEKVEYKQKYNYIELIRFEYDDKEHTLENERRSFSRKWYERAKNNGVTIDKMRKNIRNFFRNKKVLYQDGEYVKSSSEHNLWTVYDGYQQYVQDKGYKNSWVAFNCRATNEYKDRTVIAYPINVFMNPVVANFFKAHGVEIDEDAYSLSEEIQFIWRSGIRDGKHITIYMPSSRMRMLLGKWMIENSRKD